VADANCVSDEGDGRNGELDPARAREAGGLGALQEAVREILSVVGEDPERARRGRAGDGPDPSQPTSGAESLDRSSDDNQAEAIPPRRVHSVQSSRIVRFLVGGALVAVLMIVMLSRVTSHQDRKSDVVAQSCVVHGFGAEATVVVTNHGRGTASYLFDVEFSQHESARVSVPFHVTALPAGNSETVHASAGSLDTSTTPTCTITNLQRLAGG
jgi:hypothetical protein